MTANTNVIGNEPETPPYMQRIARLTYVDQ